MIRMRRNGTSAEATDSRRIGQLVDVADLSKIVGVSAVTLLTWRSRSPWLLPPPINKKPLRWRASTIDAWLACREQVEAERCAMLKSKQTRGGLAGWSSVEFKAVNSKKPAADDRQ